VISAGVRNLRVALGLCVLLGACVFGVGVAAAEDEEPVAKPPLFTGITNFPTIKESADPEKYFWEVQLHPGQELAQVDERHAEVLFEGEMRTSLIGAEQARDATGAEVPTSLEVIAPNLIALTVHHKAGNPAAGGAPFHYPVSAGPPFTAGYSTVRVLMPEEEKPAAVTPPCVVPKLTGRSLAGSRARLVNAGCKLGAVRGKRGKGAKVVKQFKAPGTVFGSGASVAVKLG
jgi:hypothetical protein